MSKTKEQIVAMAEQTAQARADAMVARYVASVESTANDYIEGDFEPDIDDFFAWVEGYDWS